MKNKVRVIVLLTLVVAVASGSYFGWQWWLAQQPDPLPQGIVFGNGRFLTPDDLVDGVVLMLEQVGAERLDKLIGHALATA